MADIVTGTSTRGAIRAGARAAVRELRATRRR